MLIDFIASFVGILSPIPQFDSRRHVFQDIRAFVINFIHQAVDKYNETNTGK